MELRSGQPREAAARPGDSVCRLAEAGCRRARGPGLCPSALSRGGWRRRHVLLPGFYYPVTPEQARAPLDDFLGHRFHRFGAYEDAIHPDEAFLFHSMLAPALNIGLISPQQVVDAALGRAGHVPLNSPEGFVRQIIGWREYMRGV